MSPKVSPSLLVVANILVPIALLTFATGFFPYKPFVPGRATFDSAENAAMDGTAPFEKVIFMVVDALRSDFVYSPSSGFRFTQSLIRSGAAIPFTAHATSPTITMPRVKAITTGSIPSFLDVILNFAESDTTSSLANQDTWLSQLKSKPGGKLVMYGDDTWLKLFPDTFSRADGTSSFFVSDFTEVDNNVTRHVPAELKRDDWNGMILHYLGLDHIGHKSGPRSPYMIPKQHEMDGIIKTIYEAIESEQHLRSTLLILCGDHGMNDAGNHGGSAEGETSPALVFLSPKLQAISKGIDCPVTLSGSDFDYYGNVEQSDIAPTLAGLLGFPVPLNNLGVFIPEFLSFWSDDKKARLMQQNARQILHIVQGTFPNMPYSLEATNLNCTSPCSDSEILSCMWSDVLTTQGQPTTVNALRALTTFCTRAQRIMSSTASNYNVSRLNLGIGIATAATIAALELCFGILAQAKATGLWIFAVIVMYGLMMFASSYVEEEQHFWYWMASGWLVWLLMKQSALDSPKRVSHVALAASLLFSLRILRAWNQTGQKHAGEPDIARSFLPAHNSLLWILVVATYVDVVQRLARKAVPWASRRLSSAASLGLGVAALGFKVAFTKADAPELLAGLEHLVLRPMEEASLVAQARAVFLSSGIMLMLTIWPVLYSKIIHGKTAEDITWPMHKFFTLFLMTQSRATNVPLFLMFEVQFHALSFLGLATIEVTLTSLLFQYVSFFAFGGSNAISSIDLSNAYNGVAGYNVIAVGILTFIGNWAGPLWWTSATMLLLSNERVGKDSKKFVEHLSLLTIFASSSVLFVMLACTVLKTHLFIWTVFSPKYLYSIAWNLGQHLCINVGYGSLVFWIGSW